MNHPYDDLFHLAELPKAFAFEMISQVLATAPLRVKGYGTHPASLRNRADRCHMGRQQH